MGGSLYEACTRKTAAAAAASRPGLKTRATPQTKSRLKPAPKSLRTLSRVHPVFRFLCSPGLQATLLYTSPSAVGASCPPNPHPRSLSTPWRGRALRRKGNPGLAGRQLSNVSASTATPPSSPQRMPTLRQRARRTATVLYPPQRKLIGRNPTLSTATYSDLPQPCHIHRKLPRFAATDRNPPQRLHLHRNVPGSTATSANSPQLMFIHRNVAISTATSKDLPQRLQIHRNPCLSTAT